MYVLSADTYTIRQRETQKAELLQEQHSKTSLTIGLVRPAESARSTLRSGTERLMTRGNGDSHKSR